MVITLNGFDLLMLLSCLVSSNGQELVIFWVNNYSIFSFWSSFSYILTIIRGDSSSNQVELSVNQIVQTFVLVNLGWLLDVDVDWVFDILFCADHAIVIHSTLLAFFEITSDVTKVDICLNVTIWMHK